jgi:uncharacterized protein (TIGR02996 family)
MLYRAPRPEVLALLEAVKDTPPDDRPRLALADWLEAHGDNHDRARAEFVRLQCRSARLTPADPERARLRRREAELLGRHQEAWLGPLRERVAGWQFQRGLLSVRAVWRRFTSRVMAALAASETGAWVGHLRLQYVPAAAMARVAAAPLLAQLTGLGLPYNHLGPRGIAALFSSPHLTRLTQLDLSGTGLEDEGAAALAAAPGLGRLTALDLGMNRVRAEGARVLAAAPVLANLGHLGLFGNALGDRGACALASSPVLGGLTSLDLRGNGIGDEGALALAASPCLTSLAALRVEGNRIGGEGAAALRQRFGTGVRLVAGGSPW